MNYYFDEDSQKLIIDAKKEMFQLKHPYVGSEHLFLAILKNSSLDISKKLNELGITYSLFLKELLRVVGVGTKANNWFLFTPLLRKIIQSASYNSRNSDKLVTPYNLLVSILQEGDGVANRILLGMNIDLEVLYDKFLNFEVISDNNTLLLDEIAVNMNKLCRDGNYDPVIGRDKEINQIIQILLRKNKNNPLLIGEAGVGKTAIVEELARRITLGNVPFKLKDKVIYNLSMSVLVSGTKYRGEFEEKIHKIINEVMNNSNIILFIDEIHTLVGAGGAEGAIDASNIVKPYLARGDLKIIGATTVVEYSHFISKDKALERRFQKVYIEEPSYELIKNIIFELKKTYESFHHVLLSEKILLNIIDFSNNLINYGRQPDKAIDLLDEVCSYSFVKHNKMDSNIRNYDIESKKFAKLKNEEIMKHNFKKALEYKNLELKALDNYNHMLLKYPSSSTIYVTEDDVYFVLYHKLNIPTPSELRVKLDNLDRSIKNDMILRRCLVKKIINEIRKEDFLLRNRPLSFLFVGKSGVGKTFLSEKIEKSIFSSNQVYRFSMGDYQDHSSIYKLKGSYQYNYEESPFIGIRENPFSLIVFENIDKAHPSILKFLINILDNGLFQTTRGDNISFSKTIIIFTVQSSNKCIGFLDNEVSNNYLTLLKNSVSLSINFKDVSIKDIEKLVLKLDTSLDNKHINYILKESDYLNSGFRNVRNLLKNKIKL